MNNCKPTFARLCTLFLYWGTLINFCIKLIDKSLVILGSFLKKYFCFISYQSSSKRVKIALTSGAKFETSLILNILLFWKNYFGLLFFLVNFHISSNCLNEKSLPLSRWLNLSEHCPLYWKVVGSIPGQGTYLDCGFNPLSGSIREATSWCFSHQHLSLLPALSLSLLPLSALPPFHLLSLKSTNIS